MWHGTELVSSLAMTAVCLQSGGHLKPAPAAPSASSFADVSWQVAVPARGSGGPRQPIAVLALACRTPGGAVFATQQADAIQVVSTAVINSVPTAVAACC